MRAKIIALPVAAGLALGGASLATAEDPPKQPRPRPVAPVEAVPFEHPPLVTGEVGPALPFFAGPGPFGLHSDIAKDMAKELELPEERVVAAMRKAIAAQFDRQRDEALKCFDDRKACKEVAALPGILPRHVRPRHAIPVRPGRTRKP